MSIRTEVDKAVKAIRSLQGITKHRAIVTYDAQNNRWIVSFDDNGTPWYVQSFETEVQAVGLADYINS